MIKLIFLSLLFIGVSSSFKQLNTVAFRMDDIQDDYSDTTMIDVINVFKDQNLPFTVVIIGHDFSDDSKIIGFIKNCTQVPGWDFEVGNHGWLHEDFTKAGNVAAQELLFNEAINKTLGLLKGYVSREQFTTFVPPYNAFNDDTLQAMKNVGFNLISGETDMETITNLPGPDAYGIYHWPIGAATTDLSDTVDQTAAQTFAQIQSQMATYGFAAVMTHPEEFANNWGNGEGDDTGTNATMLNYLKDLITMCQQAGYDITNLRGLTTKYLGGAITPSTTGAASVPSTTGAPAVPSTTGAAAVPSTTGAAAVPSTTGAAAVPSTTGAAAVPSTTGAAAVPSTTGSPSVASTSSLVNSSSSSVASSTSGSTSSSSSSAAASSSSAAASSSSSSSSGSVSSSSSSAPAGSSSSSGSAPVGTGSSGSAPVGTGSSGANNAESEPASSSSALVVSFAMIAIALLAF